MNLYVVHPPSCYGVKAGVYLALLAFYLRSMV